MSLHNKTFFEISLIIIRGSLCPRIACITKTRGTAKVTQEKAYIMKYKLIKNCIESKEPFKCIPTTMCKILPEISANCQKD